ncbi:UNVERIFIED_CONTAM: hypothetical protein GTU68_006216 [Idotea baltica]|nr:hypothetical protein [Idotea baltica]
MENLLL